MLTQKQNRFVDAYVVSGNGTKSAILAGYSARTARSIACENLQKPEIAAEIKRRSAARARKAEADQLRVLTKLKNIAFANIQDVLNPDGTLKDPANWPEDARDAFWLIKTARTPKGRKNGKSKTAGAVIKIQTKHSLKALDMLAKHLGLFPHSRRSSKKRDLDWNGPPVRFVYHPGPAPRETNER